MRRLLLLAFALPVIALAQSDIVRGPGGSFQLPSGSLVPISADSVTDSFGRPLPLARLCFLPVDGSKNISGFGVGSTQVIPNEVCGLVTMGLLQSGLQVEPTPPGVYYHIYAKTSNSNTILRDFGLASIPGPTWTLDGFQSSIVSTVGGGLQFGTLTNAPAGQGGSCTITGGNPYLLNCAIPSGGGNPGQTYHFPTAVFSVDGQGNVSFLSQSQHAVFAAPLNGNGAPGFRTLSASDIFGGNFPLAMEASSNFTFDIGPTIKGLGFTTPQLNGDITVDGTLYPNLNAAWNGAFSLALTGSHNITVRLGPGTYLLTAPLVEPIQGNCVSLEGSGSITTAASAGIPNSGTVIGIQAGSGYPTTQDVIQLINSGNSQAHGCTFRNFTLEANLQAPHGFNLQWFRGLTIENVAIKDTSSDGILLGEASGTHQSSGYFRNITVSYDATMFNPSNRPNYGINLQPTFLDSFFEFLLVRNAKQAAVFNAGGGNVFDTIHGFGFPYTCTTPPCNNTTETNPNAADASYATNYEVIDNGTGGNMYFNTYMDSPAIAAFDLKQNGVQVNGGHIQWPETNSFPAANLAVVESTYTQNLVISNVDCLNMSANAGINQVAGEPSADSGWVTYMGASGTSPAYSSVSNLAGCGNYYQERSSARQKAYDIGGNNSSNINYGAGNPGITPKVFVTPLSTQASEGGVEVENFAGGLGDTFYSGFSGQASNFAVQADGTVHTGGGLQTNVVAITASTTLTKANHIVLASASSGALTLTLPSCLTAMPDGLTPLGMEFTVIKTDTSSNAVNFATTSSQTINVLGATATTYALTAPGGITLACGPDSNWYSPKVTGTATHMTWSGVFIGTFGTSTNNSLGTAWSPSVALNITHLDTALGTAPSGCSTFPVIGIFDSTSSTWLKTVTMASSTFTYHNAVTGVTVAAGHNLSMGVQTAGVGCSTNPAAAQLTMEYTMTQ